MMQVSKKIKRDNYLEECLLPYFTKKSKWLIIYFCLALGCDMPILESFLFLSLAQTQGRRDQGCHFLDELKKFISVRISEWYPTWIFSDEYPILMWKPQVETQTGKDIISIFACKGELSLKFLDHRSPSTSNPPTLAIYIVLLYGSDVISMNNRSKSKLRSMKWGHFMPLLEDYLDRFRPVEQK
jgi:hypothetical protein